MPSTTRVLWVDDEPDNNAPFASDLERRGLHVSYALTTGLALTLLARNKYLAVISDMGRKEGPREGLHLLDAMRSRGVNTPFFIFAPVSVEATQVESLLHDATLNTNDWRTLLREIERLWGERSSSSPPTVSDRE